MARYWVGNTGNWNDTTHWSLTSNGSTGATVPSSIDDVYFDAASFSSTSSVTLDVSANCLSMNWTGLDQAVTFTSSIYPAYIYGDLTLASGLTWTFSGTAYTYLKATGAKNITTNGIIISNALYFDGVGGSWTNQDDFKVTGTPELLNGTWKTNNKLITIGSSGNGFIRNDHSTATRRMEMGSSAIEGGLYFSQPAGFTLDASTSTITSENYVIHAGTLNNIVHKGHSILGPNGGTLGSFTCVNLTCNNITGRGWLCFVSNVTVTGTLTINGFNSTTQRCLVNSSTVGTQRTITAANLTATNIDFVDTLLAGACNKDLSAITGGSGNAGGNSGITFTPAATQYYKHTSGACNWSDSKWFTTSGGAIASRMPLAQDSAIFDTNSFAGTSNLTMNVPGIGSLDMSGVNQAVTFTMTIVNIECYGDFILGSNITTSINKQLYLRGRSSHQLKAFACNISTINVEAPGGTYTLGSDLTCLDGIGLGYGSILDFNGFNSTTPRYSNNGGAATTTYLRSGLHTCTQAGTLAAFNFAGTVNAGTSTIKFNPQTGSSNIYAFYGPAYNLYRVWFSGIHTGSFYMNYLSTNQTIQELVIDAGKTIKFNAGTTTNIGSLRAFGSASKLITIESTTAATHNITGTTSNWECDYLSITNSILNASSPTKTAGIHSVNVSGNTNWDFSTDTDLRYWIGDSGNYNDPTHWSTSSGGTATISLGSQLLANTSFVTDTIWVKNAGWSIDTGTGKAVCTNGSSIGIYQSGILTAGKLYRITYTIDSITTGYIQRYGFDSITARTTAGTYVEYDRAGTSTYCGLRAYNNCNAIIDNITVEEVLNPIASTTTVIFDASSFTTTGKTVTIDGIANCKSMIWNNVIAGQTLTSSIYGQNIYGNLVLDASLSWTNTGTAYLYMKAIDSSRFITTNACPTFKPNQLILDSSSASWIHQDNFTLSSPSYITTTNGTWNTNNKTIYSAAIYSSTGTSNWLWGSSVIYSGSVYCYNGTVNITPGTSRLILGNLTSTNTTFLPSGKTFYDVEIYYVIQSTVNSTAPGTYHNLTVYKQFSIGNTHTVTGTLITPYVSTTVRPLLLSNTLGVAKTISAADVSLYNVDFRDITLSGSCNKDLSGIIGGSGDGFGNSAITFTPAINTYLKSTASTAMWSDSSIWVTSDGLTLARVPLLQDTAIFDSSSFSQNCNLSLNVARISNIDLTNINKIVTLTFANNVDCYKDFVLKSDVIISAPPYKDFGLMGRGNYNISTFGITNHYLRYNFQCLGGKYTYQSNLFFFELYSITAGCTVDCNDFDSTGGTYGYFGNSGTFYMGNGTFTIRRSDAVAGFGNGGSPAVIYSEGSTLLINCSGGAGANSVLLNGIGWTANKVKVNIGATSTLGLRINCNMIIDELILDAGSTLILAAGTNQTINKLTAIGNATQRINLTSYTAAQHTLTSPAIGSIKADWLNLSYSNATGGARFYAGANSSDGGNNTGWLFYPSQTAGMTVRGRTVIGPNVITDGLQLYLDTGNIKSYSGSGNSWNDLISNRLFTGSDYSWASNINEITINVFLEKIALDNVNYATHPIIKSSGIGNASFVLYHFGNYLGNAGDGRFGFYFTTANDGWRGHIVGVLGLNEKAHMCFQYSSTLGSQVWLNGVKSGRTEYRGALGVGNTSNLYVNGPIDPMGKTKVYNISFYNRDLSDSEVIQNYNALKSRFIK